MELTSIINESLNYISSFALRCAASLDIAGHIQAYGRPMPLNELARSIPISPDKDVMLGRLMALLVQKEIFAQDETGYALTPLSTLLSTEHPNMGAFVCFMTDPIIIKFMFAMSEWFIKGEAGSTVFTMTYDGKQPGEILKENPEFAKLFNEAMLTSRCKQQMKEFVKSYPHIFDGLNSLVDVGGNTGTAVKIIAKAFPFLRCTVLDLPHVVAEAAEDDTFNVVAGSMLEIMPPAEAFLIKNVLYDWGDEDCVRILKRCREAIQPRKVGSKVVIVDMIQDFESNSPKATETGLLFDLHVMCCHGSKERSKQKWHDIILGAGFSGYKIHPTQLGGDCVMELYA